MSLEPFNVQEKEIKAYLKDFEDMEHPLQEKWATDLHQEFRTGVGSIYHDPNFCYRMVDYGVMETLVRVILLKSTTDKTRYHMHGALRNLMYLPKCKHAFLKTPNCEQIFWKLLDSSWATLISETLYCMQTIIGDTETSLLKPIFTPELMRKALFKGYLYDKDILASFEGDGKCQLVDVFPHCDPKQVNNIINTSFCTTYRRNGISTIGNYITRLVGKINKLYFLY